MKFLEQFSNESKKKKSKIISSNNFGTNEELNILILYKKLFLNNCIFEFECHSKGTKCEMKCECVFFNQI